MRLRISKVHILFMAFGPEGHPQSRRWKMMSCRDNSILRSRSGQSNAMGTGSIGWLRPERLPRRLPWVRDTALIILMFLYKLRKYEYIKSFSPQRSNLELWSFEPDRLISSRPQFLSIFWPWATFCVVLLDYSTAPSQPSRWRPLLRYLWEIQRTRYSRIYLLFQ